MPSPLHILKMMMNRLWPHSQRLNIQHAFFTFLICSYISILFNNYASSYCLRLCLILWTSFSLAIIYSFSMALSTLMLLWSPKLRKHIQLPITNTKCFWQVPHFFPSLNIPPVTFIFLHACHLLINAWSSKLIWPINTSLCVLCTTMWKHFTSSLWMNVAYFIFNYSTSLISLY